jgi:hypothetical protein
MSNVVIVPKNLHLQNIILQNAGVVQVKHLKIKMRGLISSSRFKAFVSAALSRRF